MNAVIYSRVSTEEQSQNGSSLEMQETRCAAFAASKGWTVTETIRDGGFSAKDLNRPGMQRVLQLVKQRTVEAVLILKLDRLTRSVSDLGNLLALFDRKKVALAGPEVVFDTSTSAGRLIANLLCSVSQWEREQIGERTHAVLQHRRLSGLTYSAQVPFGYRRVGEGKWARFVPVTHELEAVVTMHKLRAHGFSLRKIAHHLTVSGVVTKRGRSEWSPTSVRSILKNNRKEVAHHEAHNVGLGQPRGG